MSWRGSLNAHDCSGLCRFRQLYEATSVLISDSKPLQDIVARIRARNSPGGLFRALASNNLSGVFVLQCVDTRVAFLHIWFDVVVVME